MLIAYSDKRLPGMPSWDNYIKAYPESLFNALNDVLAKVFVRMVLEHAGVLRGVLMVVISVIGVIKELRGPPLSRASKSLVYG